MKYFAVVLCLLLISCSNDLAVRELHYSSTSDEKKEPPYPQYEPTYFISNSLGNDEWSGTLPEPNGAGTDGPWKRLSMIGSKNESGTYRVVPGDIIALRRSDQWIEPELNSYCSYKDAAIAFPPETGGDKPIIISAYGEGKKPLIDGGEIASGGETYVLLCISGGSNIIIQDIHFKAGTYNYPGSGIVYLRPLRNNISDIIIRGVEIDNERNSSTHGINLYRGGGEGFDMTNIEISHSKITGFGKMLPFGDQSKEAKSAIIVSPKVATAVNIHHNQIFHSYNGIFIYSGAGHNISYNFIAGIDTYGIYINSGDKQVADVTVKRNIITAVGNYGIYLDNVSNTVIAHNTIYNPEKQYSETVPDGSMRLTQDSAAIGSFAGNVIQNNIFTGTTVIEGITADVLESNSFSNNLYYSENDTIISGGITIQSDNFESNWLTNENVTGDFIASPLFKDPYSGVSEGSFKFCYSIETCGDFSLSKDSPAQDAAIAAEDDEDFNGKQISAGDRVNLGAIE